MLRKLALLAVLSFAAWLPAAGAVGLGEVEVGSALNQRFVATIPLLGATPEELENLQVRLASNADFERAGIERSEYLSSLRFTIRTDGSPRIEVRSPQIAREPFVNFLLEVRAGSNRFLREYTVLLDPPSFVATPERDAETAVTESARATPPPLAVAPVTPAAPERPRREERPYTAARETTGTYGPVRPQETFWSIATQLRPDPALTMDQVLLALYNANPQAFDGGINKLLAGSMLRVPSAETMAAIPPAEAKRRVAALRGERAGAAAAAPRVRADAPSPATRPRVAPESGLTAEPAPNPVSPGPSAPAAAQSPQQTPAAPTARSQALAPAGAAAAVIPSPAPAAEPPSSLEPAADAPATPAPSAEAPSATAAGDTAVGAASESSTTPAPADATAPDAAANESAPAPETRPAPPPIASEPVDTATAGPMELLVPVIGALLVLGGLGYLLSNWLRKRREASRVAAEPPAVPPVTPSMGKPLLGAAAATLAAKTTGNDKPSAAATTQSELEKLSASLDEDAADFETQQFQTQQLQARADLLPDAGADADPFAAELSEAEAARQALEQGAVDFDLGSQMASETMHINLDEGDPLAEADFHLAYGLYDEAILHLKQAAEKDPGRVELRVKLAETYFAAGKADEFETLARELRDEVEPSTWQKITLMGQQLCPYSDLFQGSAVTDTGAVDLSLTTSVTPPPDTTSEVTANQQGGDDLLDFKLDDIDFSADSSAAAPSPEAKRDNTLEFDLGDFDLGEAPSSAEPTPQADPVPTSGSSDNAIDFELENFDISAPEIEAPRQEPAGNEIRFDLEPMDLKLEDFDAADLGDNTHLPSGDEAATKLDLARAYVDMGDNDMARGLLNEVVAQGSEAQQDEAKQLLARIA